MRHRKQADGGTRRLLRGGWTAALLVAALAACDRQPTAAGERLARPGDASLLVTPGCTWGTGTVHTHETLTTAVMWSRAASPHHVTDTTVVDAGGQLILLPGAQVCFAYGGAILARNGGRLHARGLDTARILLTAYNPAFGWDGVDLSDDPPGWNSYLTNVVLEHVAVGRTAVTTRDAHPVIMDSAVVRQSGQALNLLAPFSKVARSRIDTTTDRTRPAVVLGDSVIWQRNTLRRAAGVGLRVEGTVGVYLLGGRIEGSGGAGLQVPSSRAVKGSAPVRVTGGGAHPAELAVGAFAQIYPNPADQDSLLGNARDTLYVTGDTLSTQAYARAVLPWHVQGRVDVDSTGVLTAQPGARLSFDPGVGIYLLWSRMVARGTPAAPVVFTADDPALGWSGMQFIFGSDTSYLTNVRIEHVGVYETAVDATFTPLVIDSAVIRQSGMAAQLLGDARISRTRVDTTLGSSAGMILGYDSRIESTLIRAPGGPGLMVLHSTVQIVSCEVRDGSDAGIVMQSAVAVHDCNLVNNAWPGIMNLSQDTADVTGNWWGDAAGPTGPSGDGVSGPLSYTPWRTTPFVLPYVP
jgi:hypothetical protein